MQILVFEKLDSSELEATQRELETRGWGSYLRGLCLRGMGMYLRWREVSMSKKELKMSRREVR